MMADQDLLQYDSRVTPELPEPLTPPDCDLRGMPYMPVDIVRLFDSDLYALATGDEFRAAFTLWGRAFLQARAGSVPSDDRILAHLSGSGAKWKKVRAMALRGWVKCSDGRLYHPVVAEKALEAWRARSAQKARTEAARAARHMFREVSDKPPVLSATVSVTQNVAESATISVTENVTGSKLSKVKGSDSTPPVPIGTGSPTAAEQRKPRSKARSAIPPDWQPDEAGAAYAAERGVDLQRELPAFRDHHVAKGNLMADWSAAWRTWCRNAVQFGRAAAVGKPPDLLNGHGPPSVRDRLLALPGAFEPDQAHVAQWPGDAGHVVLHGYYADVMWDKVAEASGLPWDWPGDLTPLADWLQDDLPDREGFYQAIRRCAERAEGGVRSLRYFDAAVRDAPRVMP